MALTVLLLFQTEAFRAIPYVDPLDRRPSTAAEYASARIDAPLRVRTVAQSSRDGSYSRLVLVFVNSGLYPAIAPELSSYALDLSFEGYTAKVVSTSGGRAADLKQIMLAHRDSGLVGTVMVGDLPVAWWSNGARGEDFPLDLFFTALNGSFTDADGDGRYDDYSGSIAPVIWLGRIYASRMTYASEDYLVKSYFQRNHQYRTGQLPVPARGLAYNEVDWYPNSHGMNNLFSNVTQVNDENTTTAYHFKTTLGQGYSFVHLVSHSSPWVNTFFLAGEVPGGGSVFNFEIPALRPNAAFYFLNACMCGRYTERDNLGNWYLFSGPWSLGVIASAELMYGVDDLTGIYAPLGRDSCFGSAFLNWHRTNYSSFMGTCLLGDPTLKVRRTDPPLARVPIRARQSAAPLDWTQYAVDTANFVSGRPVMACSQGRIRIVFDSGRIVRSDNFLSSFDGTRFSRAESIGWHEYYDLFSSVAADAAGRLWVVWQSFRDYNQGYDHFQLLSSFYYNNTWSSIQRVGTLAGYHDVQPSVASGTDSVVWCAFKSWRNGQSEIWVASASNGGAWSAPVRLTSDSSDQIDPCVTVDRDNHPWVFWASQKDGRFRIQGRMHDGAWQPIFDVDTAGNNGPPRAAVAADGRVWVAWHKGNADQSQVWVSSFPDSVWSEPEPIGGGCLPALAAAPDGAVLVCWQSCDTGASDIYLLRRDPLSGWSDPEPVTGASGHNYDPSVCTDPDGNVWVAWASDRRGYWNIYAAMGPTTGVAHSLPGIAPEVSVWPNPFTRSVSFRGPQELSVDIFSDNGRRVARRSSRTGRLDWTPGGLPHGVYLARVKAGGRPTIAKLVFAK